MSKNDIAWNKFFRNTNTLTIINKSGFAFITAEELKAVGKREPRLMAKIDTKDESPKVFKDNNLAILPIKNGEYILFKDTENNLFYSFDRNDLNLPFEDYNSEINLLSFSSYPQNRSFSESQALDFAKISSLMKEFTQVENLKLCIRGRNYSKQLEFKIPSLGRSISIKGVQIEIDGGYESQKEIVLIEAKIGKRPDFNIRQIFYPYLEWSSKSSKKIIPIFMFYSNEKYYFYQFELTTTFGEISLIKKNCYRVNESPIIKISVSDLLRSTHAETVPENIPFPQANDLDKIIDLLTPLANEGMTKQDISEYFEFDERQGDYYGNALRYLGFANRNEKEHKFEISESGKKFLQLGSYNSKTIGIINILLRNSIFHSIFMLLESREYKVESVTNNEISKIVDQSTNLTGSTPERRASTVRNWIKWILDNSELV